MKISNESVHRPAAESRAEDFARHKPHRGLLLVGLPVVIFLLSLGFARLANPVSSADHPERSLRRAAIVTLALFTISVVGRSFTRPWDEH